MACRTLADHFLKGYTATPLAVMKLIQFVRPDPSGRVRAGQMSESASEPLIAVHVCKACGAATDRSAVNPDNTITGLVKCSHCGFEGDLNIEIRGKDSKRPPSKATG